MTTTARAAAGQRSLDIRVEVALPTGAVEDLILSFADHLTVADLDSHLRAKYDIPTGYRLAGLLRHASPRGPAVWCHFPPEAFINEIGLLEGERIAFTSREAGDGFWYTRPVRRESSQLHVVDAGGPSRGRSIPLPREEEVVFGSSPTDVALGVFIDDDLVDPECFSVESAADGTHAVITRIGHSHLLVNGRTVDTATVLPGSTIEIRVAAVQESILSLVPLRTILFRLTSHDDVVTRNPFGRVRHEPSTRLPAARFGRLAIKSLPRQPEPPEPPTFRFEQLLFPMVGGLLVSIIFGNWSFMLFAIIQPLVYIIGYVRDRRQGVRRHKQASGRWEREVAEAIDEFAGLVDHETRARCDASPSVRVWVGRALRGAPEIWERRQSDDDFMSVRIGVGDAVSGYLSDFNYRTVSADTTEQKRINERVLRAANMPDVPALFRLGRDNVAIVGDYAEVVKLGASVLLQLTIQNSPRDISIAAFLPDDTELANSLEWIKWLPHYRGASTLLPATKIAFGRAESSLLLDDILDRLQERDAFRPEEDSPRVQLVVHEAADVDQSKLSEILTRSSNLVHVLWLGAGQTSRPSMIDVTATIETWERARISMRAEDGTWEGSTLRWEGISPDRARFVAQRLAPLFDPLALGASGGIPQAVALSSIVDVSDYSSRSSVRDSLVVPLGVDDQGIFELDFVADGPHALIGGTTGSGKSALLQALLAGLVAKYDPDQINLVLVDYKGGSTFAAFRDLPHVVGFVSDLSAHDVVRVLDFLREEMSRRSRLFDATSNENGHPVKDYSDYTAAVGEGTLPRLFVVFDEFAALLEQQGKLNLMGRVEDLAQRGRSWGVHLILATQQPSSQVVSARTRANVGIRIALRTLDAANSETIIDAPDAALVPKSLQGRAIARLGASSLSVFQAAYVDAAGQHERLNTRRRMIDSKPFELRVQDGGT